MMLQDQRPKRHHLRQRIKKNPTFKKCHFDFIQNFNIAQSGILAQALGASFCHSILRLDHVLDKSITCVHLKNKNLISLSLHLMCVRFTVV